MGARAMWKGTLRIGKLSVPVKLYAAMQDRSVHFRLLDSKSHEPVEQRMVLPESNEVVPAEQVRKGVQLDDGGFVVLTREELAETEPTPSRDMEVSRFVPIGAVPHALHVRPYYLGPDGRSEAYFALAEAMGKTPSEGIVSWVMRKHAYHGALLLHEGYLQLVTLRHPDELVPVSALPRPSGRAPSEKELRMAEDLINSYSGDVDLASFHDEYRERVHALAEKKAKGGRVRLPRVHERKTEGTLLSALQKSVAQAERGKRVA